MLKVSVYFILPETKGVSLERMDKIFGEIDAVVAGEETVGEKAFHAREVEVGHEEHAAHVPNKIA